MDPGQRRSADIDGEAGADHSAPGKDQLIVVVNPDEQHLSRHLQISPQEIEEFLDALPRVKREDTLGCILLRVDTSDEATRLVNELKALFEIASTGV